MKKGELDSAISMSVAGMVEEKDVIKLINELKVELSGGGICRR
jgi:hypothetical protein